MSPSSSFDQKLNQLLTSLERLNPASAALLVVGLVVVAILIWLATGIYQVRPGEHAVTLRFGERCERPTGPCGEGLGTGLDTVPGVKWWWPGPIGRTEVERVDQIRRLEVGFRSGEDGGEAAPWEALMISGDLSIVDVRMVVQYRIRDLTRFLLRVKDPGDPQRGIAAGHADGLTLRYASEAALRLEVGQRSIGQLLDDDRVDL
jgi:modulator of FtsH protease HflK